MKLSFQPYQASFRWPGLEKREGFWLRVENEGREGWGEAAPLSGFSRESLADVERELADLARAVTVKEGAKDIRSYSPSVRFAFESALWDLQAPAPHGLSVPINSVLKLGQTAEPGYLSYKIKMGQQELRKDIQDFLKLVSTLPPTCSFRIDTNRAWTQEQAETFFHETLGTRIEYFEEPLSTPLELPSLISRTQMPIALDETLRELPESTYAAWAGVRAYVIKPMLQGGIIASRDLALSAQERGIRAVISSTFETHIGTRALMRLADLLNREAGVESPAGLDTYRYLVSPLPETPLQIASGMMIYTGSSLRGDRP